MSAAITSGIFALLAVAVGWLFANGSRRGRALGRLERQVDVLDKLPEDHPARVALDDAVARDAAELAVENHGGAKQWAPRFAQTVQSFAYRRTRAIEPAAGGSAQTAPKDTDEDAVKQWPSGGPASDRLSLAMKCAVVVFLGFWTIADPSGLTSAVAAIFTTVASAFASI